MKDLPVRNSRILLSIWMLVSSLLSIGVIVSIAKFSISISPMALFTITLALTLLAISLNVIGIVFGFKESRVDQVQSVVAIIGNALVLITLVFLIIYFMHWLANWNFNGN